MGRDRKKQTESKRNHRRNRHSRRSSRNHQHATQSQSRNNLNEPRGSPIPVSSSHSLNKVPSDAPTALIAPEDYQHIYRNTDAARVAVKSVESDAPTVLIAPSDYKHVYHRAKGTGTTTGQSSANISHHQAKDMAHRLAHTSEMKNVSSDAPTALIAPDDYIHIYNAHKHTTTGTTAAATELHESGIRAPTQTTTTTSRGRCQKPPQVNSMNCELFSLNESDRLEYEEVVKCFIIQKPSPGGSQTKQEQKHSKTKLKQGVEVDKAGIPVSLINKIKKYISTLTRVRKK